MARLLLAVAASAAASAAASSSSSFTGAVASGSSVLSLRVSASLSGSTVQVDPWGSNSLRVRIAAPGNPVADPPLMGLLPTPPLARGHGDAVVDGDSLSITNGNIRASVDPSSGLVTLTRPSDGVTLLRQTAQVFGAAPAGTCSGCYSGNSTFAGVGPDERIYGFGSQQDGAVSKPLPFFRSIEASEYYPYNHGSQALVGWWMSSVGYGVLNNLPSYGFYSISTSSTTVFSNATRGMDFFVTTTPSSFDPSSQSFAAPLLSQYADAVGHAKPIPYYASGFIQSKDRYFNQTQLLGVARGYVERGLPISAIVIDWFHWVQLGDWSFNPACWTDPQGMFDELHGMGIELMTTFWPFMNSTSVNWDRFTSERWLAIYEPTGQPEPFWSYRQTGDLVDTTNPYAANAVFDAFWEAYGSLGVKMVWLDGELTTSGNASRARARKVRAL